MMDGTVLRPSDIKAGDFFAEMSRANKTSVIDKLRARDREDHPVFNGAFMTR